MRLLIACKYKPNVTENTACYFPTSALQGIPNPGAHWQQRDSEQEPKRKLCFQLVCDTCVFIISQDTIDLLKFKVVTWNHFVFILTNGEVIE